MKPRRSRRVLLVGAGGLGSPAALVLARSGVDSITVVDDDVVDASNLHRQLLFRDQDVGRFKGPAAIDRLAAEADGVGCDTELQAVHGRFVPENALSLVARHDLVIEGADNFATKFLVADACAIGRVPVVQAGAVRWSGWALGTLPGQSACLRCVFEDVPDEHVETCAEAGVVGAVVGVLGALEARIALRLLAGDAAAAGVLWSYRGLDGALRRSRVRARPDCPLCAGTIRTIDESAYAAPRCVA